MPRTRDEGYWVASGARAYHPDRTRIKLVKIWNTGHIEFKPILDRIIKEIDDKDSDPEKENK